MRLYVTGPISDPDPEARVIHVKKAMAVAIRLMRKGHQVFCPHLTHFLDLYALEGGVKFSHNDWMKQDLAFIPLCEGMVATQGEGAMAKSKGSMIEREAAAVHGLKYYASVEEVPDATQ